MIMTTIMIQCALMIMIMTFQQIDKKTIQMMIVIVVVVAIVIVMIRKELQARKYTSRRC